MTKRRFKAVHQWAAKPAMPEWLDNFCALHNLHCSWNSVQSHWALIKSLTNTLDSFYVEIVPDGMKFEDFEKLISKNPPP